MTDRAQPSAHAPGTSKKAMPVWLESVLLLVLALVLAIVIKAFFLQAFYIPSPSMEPQFVKDDRILVEKVSSWGDRSPRRGDIVVFADPADWLEDGGAAAALNPFTRALVAVGLYPTGGHLVKRVIGVGGDRVMCCDAQGHLTVNGTPLDESSYLPEGTRPADAPAGDGRFDVQVPAAHLWVMGDNRGQSCDSRCHLHEPGQGFVPADLVVGRVWALIWPVKRAELIHRPATFATVPAP